MVRASKRQRNYVALLKQMHLRWHERQRKLREADINNERLLARDAQARSSCPVRETAPLRFRWPTGLHCFDRRNSCQQTLGGGRFEQEQASPQ
jgi:hypothetical protein